MSESGKRYWTEDPEIVEKYILNKYSAEEKQRLDAEIAGCEPCKQMLQQEMEIVAGIRRHGRDMVKANLRKKLNREKASQFYSYQYIGLVAAIVIIAIGLGLYQVWFSDLVAPKQFHQQEIVFKSTPDSTGGSVEPRAEETKPPTEQLSDRSVRRERATPRWQIEERAVGEIADQSASGASSLPQTMDQPVAALAEADVASDELKKESAPSAIWLIGQVVVVRTEAQISTASKIQSRDGATEGVAAERQLAAKRKMEQQKFDIRRADDQKIALQQRSMKDLPVNRSQQRSVQKEEIEVLLEKTDDGLRLTLYDDSLTESDLTAAMVETPSEDSLVVSLPNQRIALHIPATWNIQSTRRR